eukprot:CAMPEP_0181345534 /NCGR_PEP_ID=MMETSP1101-20121128/32801_1 /TAXON_ID=46948 /ORGANISM="Rhodomonas abbreviata, Strain Caron Lab Isolate" /LENGTH=217 /DNA_ID=CAMNT_0023457497 /DNA_START=9 /DNA_END=658 /DNA_ORIENTATION=-
MIYLHGGRTVCSHRNDDLTATHVVNIRVGKLLPEASSHLRAVGNLAPECIRILCSGCHTSSSSTKSWRRWGSLGILQNHPKPSAHYTPANQVVTPLRPFVLRIATPYHPDESWTHGSQLAPGWLLLVVPGGAGAALASQQNHPKPSTLYTPANQVVTSLDPSSFELQHRTTQTNPGPMALSWDQAGSCSSLERCSVSAWTGADSSTHLTGSSGMPKS